ncbi:uncharacterized protein LOC112558049 [Pomacea canaliculata]|uniref:uncharacterized protein LOC112558049 n=1 Tax=Pomacea canaliculata TaxID=400727 RepID=UPI000D733E1A|nr:uncharacterized protein LOC112558049 [Pomacea canaliculata]XP_025084018.1 uncharacterized protein LOC112558049 [Pomacea canaliculata]XP_025084019.1 uncharacterized protein LOC112558049 [Pomacea canaliculata]XP_025084021.1 uncharacterized protein LOC112558049 [Pomacea canaliculata]XP_025084022.1 uncharacterized protein LOC112558049 [Pomacea canaliculata]
MSNRGHIWVIKEDGYPVYRRGANLQNPGGRSWDKFVGEDREEERIVSSNSHQNKVKRSYWDRRRPTTKRTQSPGSYRGGSSTMMSSTMQTTDSTTSYRAARTTPRRLVRSSRSYRGRSSTNISSTMQTTDSTNSYSSLGWTLHTSQSESTYPLWTRFPTTVSPTTPERTSSTTSSSTETTIFPTKTSLSPRLQRKTTVIPSPTTGLKFKQLSLGSSGLWGTTWVGEVYYRKGTLGDPDTPGNGWTLVHSSIPMAHVASGEGIVYAVDQYSNVYYRFGILPDVPTGSDWVPLQGSLLQVSAGAFSVWGIHAGDEKVVARRAENWMQLERNDWTRISQVHMKHVACGDGGMWGVRDDARAVYYREATRKTRGLSMGSRDWVQVELPAGVSGAKMLDVGQNVVWMLDNTGQLYVRTGISDITPKGTSWRSLPSRVPFSSISVSHASTVWATDYFQRYTGGRELEPPNLLARPGTSSKVKL